MISLIIIHIPSKLPSVLLWILCPLLWADLAVTKEGLNWIKPTITYYSAITTSWLLALPGGISRSCIEGTVVPVEKATPSKVGMTLSCLVQTAKKLGQTSTKTSFPSMLVSLSGIIHHSSFTRLEIFHHIYFIYHTFRHSNPSSVQDVCPMNLV